MLPLSQPV